MADFLVAYAKLGPKEGGYANNSLDKGGETWKGIARNKHPQWQGWMLIDEAKSSPGFPENLKQFPALENEVQKFYQEEFWGPIRGNDLPQEISNELFESSVNVGPYQGIKFLQNSINILNRNQKLYPDVEADGKMGNETLGATMACIQHRGIPLLLKFMNVSQGCFFQNLLLLHPDQEEFAISWFSRVEI